MRVAWAGGMSGGGGGEVSDPFTFWLIPFDQEWECG